MRVTGGAKRLDAADQNSATGTPANDTFVGRVAGADVGYAGRTGAEARQQYTAKHGNAAAGHPTDNRR